MSKAVDNSENVNMQVANQQKSQTIFETNKFMSIFKWFIPALIVFVLLMINYAIKGIAPFGDRYISYIDMEVGYVPVYYSIWDMFHGKGNIFYNFFLGMGSNVYGSLCMNAFYSPLNWIVAIVPRGAISAFLSWLLIIKLALMATTMLYFIRKTFQNTNTYLQLLYSILWAFSGFIFVHYTNIIWLDNMIIFPFVCLGIKRIFDKNKMDLYLITLTFSLLFSFYISFMILLMVIFCGGTAVYFADKTREEKKKITSKLVVATLLALFISFVSFLPAFWQSWTSYRISGQKSEILYENTFSKAITILMSCFVLFGFIKLTTKYKQDKRNILMFIIMVAFTTITILLERANMLWHTGSYQSFPYRFSFIPIFIMICAGLYYFDRFFEKDKQEYAKKPQKVSYSTFVLLVPVVLCAIIVAVAQMIPAFPLGVTEFLIYVIMAGCIVFFLFQLFRYNSKKLNYIFVPIICFIEVFSGIFGYIGIYVSDMPVNEAGYNYNAIYENMDLPDDGYRYATYFTKQDNYYMTEFYNYPYVIRRASIANWLHIIKEDQVNYASNMGYVTSSTPITSSGANYFVNMTNNTRYVITDTELSDVVYTLVDEYNGFYVYEYKYYLPFGGVFDKDSLVEIIPEEYKNFDASNYLYNTVYGKLGTLFESVTATVSQEEDDKVKFTLTAPSNSLIYLNNSKGSDSEERSMMLNGVGFNLYSDNTELGYFDGGTIEIVVSKEFEDKLSFYAVNVDKLADLATNNSISEVSDIVMEGTGIKATVTAGEGKSLFIPLNYDTGWKAYVNGKEVTVNKAFGAFMQIDLEEGENTIEMKYSVPLLNVGLMVTLIFLALVLILWVVNKYTKFVESKVFNNIFFWVGVGAFCIAGLVVYVRPLIQTIIYLG